MPKIFISYRRADNSYAVQFIHKRLKDHYGAEDVFFDVQTIPPGVDFPTYLNENLNQCEVLLAVIGPNWLNIKDSKGNRRLDNPKDWVRQEIERALQQSHILVIPILLDNIHLPRANELPSSLQPLITRNKHDIRPGRDFDKDIDWLIEDLDKHFYKKGSQAPASLQTQPKTVGQAPVGWAVPTTPPPAKTGSLSDQPRQLTQEPTITENNIIENLSNTGLPKSEQNTTKRFSVALSFPGEHRAYVQEIATFLAKRLNKERVFYDKFYEAELARPNLDTYLQGIYHTDADLIVVFICEDYASKEWCHLEARAIRDLIKRRKDDEIMFVRVDDGSVEGIFSVDGYVDAKNHRPAEEVAQLICDRLDLQRSNKVNLQLSVPAIPAQPPEQLKPEPPLEQDNFAEDLGGGVTLEMVKIPGDTFWMGSPDNEVERSDSDNESPQHKVTVPQFWLGKYPVTQQQWERVAAFEKVKLDLQPFPSRFKGDKLPVEQVNWYEAVEFCQRLSQKTGRTYRLPSEAEWEYACRAGTATRYYFGDTITGEQVNCDCRKTVVVSEGILGIGRKEETRGIYREKTTDVGSFPPNAFGLFDMNGNVWEWCQDIWHDNYDGAPIDGNAWLEGGDDSYRLLRGGSWSYYPWHCRSAYRCPYNPDNRLYFSGFRVVCAAA